jgi:hypothetical protein
VDINLDGTVTRIDTFEDLVAQNCTRIRPWTADALSPGQLHTLTATFAGVNVNSHIYPRAYMRIHRFEYAVPSATKL